MGFRCGTCYEFHAFDFLNSKKLNLVERPLVVMEGSVLEKYHPDEALICIQKIKGYCHKYNGDFTLLWHNSTFLTPEMWNLYNCILKD